MNAQFWSALGGIGCTVMVVGGMIFMLTTERNLADKREAHPEGVVEFEGHRYLVFRDARGISALHAESCPCKGAQEGGAR